MEQTQHLPRTKLEDRFAADRPCPICGEVELAVTHLPDLPDYVKCDNCGSIFVLDTDSELVMYGSVSGDFPTTSRRILKQWLPIEVIQATAAQERPPRATAAGKAETPPFGVTGPPSPVSPKSNHDPPTPPFGFARKEQVSDRQPPASLPATDDPSSSALPRVEPPPAPAAPPKSAPLEPEPGQRYRVIVEGDPEIPLDHCSHCYRAPARRSTLARGDYESAAAFEIPLCASCYARVSSRTDEERNSQLVGQLSAVLAGGVTFVLTMALSRFGLQAAMFFSVGLATAAGAFGYGAAAFLLLRRPKQFELPEDAQYVQSTVLIQSHKNDPGLAFSWRNQRYAERFQAANGTRVKGEITKVYESGRIRSSAVTKR